jgi:hypothetical protein
MMSAKNTLYQELIDITADFLGPAASRFIDRHIEHHLKIAPTKLTKKDLGKLTSWLKLSMSLLTDDAGLNQHYSDRIETLARKKNNTK